MAASDSGFGQAGWHPGVSHRSSTAPLTSTLSAAGRYGSCRVPNRKEGEYAVLICGLKLTHDGAVALLDGDNLIFSTEVEKRANNRRYSNITDLSSIIDILAEFGYRPQDIDEWVVDGWDGRTSYNLQIHNDGRSAIVPVGPYRESELFPDPFRPALSGVLPIGDEDYRYTSYTHAAGHLASGYLSSPQAARGEPSFVLVWDGGLFPMLYWAEPGGGVRPLGALFPMIGHAYAMAGLSFGPQRGASQATKSDELSVAGKLMAYIALGRIRQPVLEILRTSFRQIFESHSESATLYRKTIGGYGSLYEASRPPVFELFREVRRQIERLGVSDEDVLASVHQFISDLLVERLVARMRDWPVPGPWNLCFVGGCALNIKWNSALRALPEVRQMWVPPFPNDSGSAIGAAALGMIQHGGVRPISWRVRSGPHLGPAPKKAPPGWTATPAGAAEVAGILDRTGEPVVVLNGRAELGPRALGGRSILAAPTSAAMKDQLNRIKGREFYRPVAPICLLDQAPLIFDPGSPDPYMLFDHAVRPDWRQKIPAVVHLDGTARLQTVSPDDDPFLAAVLVEYQKLSGIPVLCNTSANHSGSGFFPDVDSALTWGKVNFVFASGVLYQRAGS
jgi:carbamoyltransferase